jgi:hypothetical protein
MNHAESDWLKNFREWKSRQPKDTSWEDEVCDCAHCNQPAQPKFDPTILEQTGVDVHNSPLHSLVALAMSSYGFTFAEYQRLVTYRNAVRAGFYSDALR